MTLTLKQLNLLEETPPWDWPGDIGRDLLQVLGDSRAGLAERRTAAKLAGDSTVVNDAIAAALLAIARDTAEPEELRSAALIALGVALELADLEVFEEPDEVPITEQSVRTTQAALRTLHADATQPKQVRRAALEASVRAPQDWHTDAVRAAWMSEDVDWKITAAFAMQYVRGFEKQILEALDSDVLAIRAWALEAAGNWQLDEAWSTVVGLVRSPDTNRDLLLAAIAVVAQIRPDEVDVLSDLADSDDAEIADAAMEAMGEAAAMRGEDGDEELGDLDDEDDEDDDA